MLNANENLSDLKCAIYEFAYNNYYNILKILIFF